MAPLGDDHRRRPGRLSAEEVEGGESAVAPMTPTPARVDARGGGSTPPGHHAARSMGGVLLQGEGAAALRMSSSMRRRAPPRA